GRLALRGCFLGERLTGLQVGCERVGRDAEERSSRRQDVDRESATRTAARAAAATGTAEAAAPEETAAPAETTQSTEATHLAEPTVHAGGTQDPHPGSVR